MSNDLGRKCTSVKAIDASHRYCGPAALAAIIGIPTREAAEIIAYATYEDARRAGRMRGVFQGHLKKAFLLLGYTVETQGHRSTMMTVQKFLRSNPCKTARVLVCGNHYIAVKGRKIVDSSVRIPRDVKDHPCRLWRVTWEMKVWK